MKPFKLFIIFTLVSLAALGCNKKTDPQSEQTPNESNQPTQEQPEAPAPEKPKVSNPEKVSGVQWPIDEASERITKKKFGIKVSPQNSPVSPEKFSGYHNAVDFEILEGEENADVSIRAICDGKLLRKQTSSGYGGVLVQACTINNEAVTVIYGHIRLSSVAASVGSTIALGQTVGVLGTGYSKETDGERKHLHLGIHKGTSVDIRGYVQQETDLKNWIDITTLVK